MGRDRKDRPSSPPLVAWSTGRLVVFAILLPVVGAALLAAPIVLSVRAGTEAWQPGERGRSILGFGWLLVMGLWCLGFTWVIIAELRRRRRNPSADEEAERHKASLEAIEDLRKNAHDTLRTSGWFFLAGLPALCICVAYRWRGGDPPDWAAILALPLIAMAPLYWMRAVLMGIALWIREGRPSRWLGYASLIAVAYFGIVWIVVLSYLRN